MSEDREGVRLEIDAQNFAHVTLSRPDKFNTFTDAVGNGVVGLLVPSPTLRFIFL